MKINQKILTLTLVLLSLQSLAKPHKDAEIPQKPEPSEQTDSTDKLSEQNLSLTPFPKKYDQQLFNKKYYPYHHAFTPRVAALIDVNEISTNRNINYLVGVRYLIPKYYSPKWEVGFDLANNSIGYLSLFRRYIISEKESLRPYYKFGITHKIEARGKLANLGNYENYLASISLGMEDLLKDPASVQLELEASIGKNDVLGLLSLGYSWGLN